MKRSCRLPPFVLLGMPAIEAESGNFTSTEILAGCPKDGSISIHSDRMIEIRVERLSKR